MDEQNQFQYLSSLYPQQGTQASPSLSANDVVSNDLYMSPQEIDAYNQYQNMRPAIGAQAPYTYYPDAHNNIAVGNSSGSIIGSQTLFAPGGGLIPLGLMDARDKAVMQAALTKQKEVEDFRKQFKAPTSKLTNINQGLTDEYFNYLDSSWKSALKRAGGDPNRATAILKSNPDFWAKEKSFQDLAKRGDAVVGKIADIEDRVKKGDLMSPALIEAKNKVLADMNPTSDGFRYLSSSIMKMDADRDFSDAANEALKSLVTNKTGKVLNLSNPEEFKIYKETVEQLDPEAIRSVKDNLKKVYANSTLYSPEYIDRNIDGLTKYKKVTKDLDISAKPKQDESENYSETDILKEPSSTNVYTRNQNQPGGATSISNGIVIGDYGVTHKKPINAIIPTGAHFYVNDEKNGLLKSDDVDPNSKIRLFKTELMKVYDGPAKEFDGTPLSEEQIAAGRKWKWAPVTRGVMKTLSKDKAGDENEVEREIFVPTREIENVLVKKRGRDGKVEKGVPVDKLYEEADKRNASSKTSSPAKTPTKVEDLRKKYNY